MKKIVTIIAGLTISLSLISETRTDSGIVYVNNEMTRSAENEAELYASKKTGSKLQSGMASYYGKGLHGSRTASGERHNRHEMVAAHRSLPFGTKVKVTNLSNGKEVIVKINDRGPFIKGRVIDLSYGAFSKIENPGKGITKVKLDILK